MQFSKISLIIAFTLMSLNVQAAELYSFVGQSKADPTKPCRISYWLDNDTLKLAKYEGVGSKWNVMTGQASEVPADQRNRSDIQFSPGDLEIYNSAPIRNAILRRGQVAGQAEWDAGIRAATTVKTPQTFQDPQSLSAKIAVRLGGVHSLLHYHIECENLRRETPTQQAEVTAVEVAR